MMALSDGERISMIRSAVTDRRTDGIGVAYTRYSIYAVARKNINYLWSRDTKSGPEIITIFVHSDPYGPP